MTCYRLTNQKIPCKCFGAVGKWFVTECVVSTTIRYTHFHWLIYKLKRSRQEFTRSCLKRGCVRSFHERQKKSGERNERANFNRLLRWFKRSISLWCCKSNILSMNRFLFVCFGFSVPHENVSLIWRRHHYQWRAANFDLYSALMAIEQWRFFSVPYLLWPMASNHNGHLWGSVILISQLLSI